MTFDESEINLTLSAEEHELLQSALLLLTDSFDVMIDSVMNLPEDSTIAQRYETLHNLRQKISQSWCQRFS